MYLSRQQRKQVVPLTLEAVTQVMRQYLESRAGRLGPDFEGWVACHFPSIRHAAAKKSALTVGALVSWAESYLKADKDSEEHRRIQEWHEELRRFFQRQCEQ